MLVCVGVCLAHLPGQTCISGANDSFQVPSFGRSSSGVKLPAMARQRPQTTNANRLPPANQCKQMALVRGSPQPLDQDSLVGSTVCCMERNKQEQQQHLQNSEPKNHIFKGRNGKRIAEALSGSPARAKIKSPWRLTFHFAMGQLESKKEKKSPKR